MTATATARKGKNGKATAAKRGQTLTAAVSGLPGPIARAADMILSAPTGPASPAKPAGKADVPDARYVEAPPNAYKTLTALREMGYGSVESVADLVDNAVDADATRIAVQVRAAGKGDPKPSDGDTGIIIDVLDNGRGMSRDTLNQALRLGSDTAHDAADLGKYGMGLVTASLGMARSVYVLTRTDKAQAFEAVLDVDDVAKHNKFLIALTPVTDGAKVLDTIGNHGTLVRLTKVDRIDDTNVARFAAVLRTRFAQTYREFIKAGVKLSVNGKVVQAADPLMRDNPETRVVLDQGLTVEGHNFHLTAVELPDLGFVGNQDAGIFPHLSGVYVQRNGRQIMAAQTFGLYRHHHSYSGFRAELSFGKDADGLFHVDVMKSKVQPDERLVAKLADALGPIIAAVGKNGRTREAPTGAATVKIDHAADLLNERLAKATAPTPAAKPAPAAKAKGETAAAKGDDEPTGKTPHMNGNAAGQDDGGGQDSKGTGTPPEPADKSGVKVSPPPVKWGQESMPDTNTLYRAVEKDGRWLIVLNTRHPLVQTVADARHKAASAVLTYMVFALASATKGKKNGQDMVDEIGATLASVLGTPEA